MATPLDYTAADIQVLEGLQPIRLRPGMFVGGTDAKAMHVCLWEVIGNAFDECIAGHGRHIEIAFDGTRVTVEDDGRGIPVPAIVPVFTQLHSGGAWRRDHQHLSPGLHGIGAVVANALASELEITVWRDGHEFMQRFERGVATGEVECVRPVSRTGTRVSFVPDVTIFGDATWDIAAIAARCRTLAALWPGLSIAVDDVVYAYDSLADMLAELAGQELIDPLVVHRETDSMLIQLGLAWTRDRTSSLEVLINSSPCIEGTHVEGLHAALFEVIGPHLRLTRKLFRDQITRGLVGVLSVQLSHPSFGNPTRDWLRNPEVGAAVHAVVSTELARHLANAPALLDAMVLDLAPRVRVRTDGRGSEAPVRTRLRRRRSA